MPTSTSDSALERLRQRKIIKMWVGWRRNKKYKYKKGRVYAINRGCNDNYRANPPSPNVNLQIGSILINLTLILPPESNFTRSSNRARQFNARSCSGIDRGFYTMRFLASYNKTSSIQARLADNSVRSTL
jgi:hypothetical protein